jgi:hypothetical protein
VDKRSETDIAVNYFATEEQCIRAHLPGTPELLVPFAALKTDIYEKCKTHEFVSLAYIYHIESNSDMLVDPEGIMNTYLVASQYIVGRDPSVVPFPPTCTSHHPSKCTNTSILVYLQCQAGCSRRVGLAAALVCQCFRRVQ